MQKQDIINALKDKSLLARIIEEAFREKLFNVKDDKNITYNGLQIINRQVIIEYIKRLLAIDQKLTPFSILGLEKPIEMPFDINTQEGLKQISLFGNIDRIDKIDENGSTCIRVVDYKTGSNDKTSIKSVDDIFNPEKIENHSDYYLQALLYSIMLYNNRNLNPNHLPVSPALLFIQHATGDDYTPILKFGKDIITDISIYTEDFLSKLKELIEDIFNPNIAFNPTENTKRCQYCPYREICG